MDYDNYEPAYLEPDKRFKVWVVEPLGNNSNRYYKPIRCLEGDLEVIKNSGDIWENEIGFTQVLAGLLGVEFNANN